MLRVNEFQIYELANAVHPLTTLSNGATYPLIWFDLYQARTALFSIFNQRALEVCIAPANELVAAIRGILPDDFAEATAKLGAIGDPPPAIGIAAYSIREAALKFETVLSAELSNSDTYWISPKGTRKTSVLMTSARYELPQSTLDTIPAEAAVELDEAGRCLLFNVSTAAGFHLFRATESVIRKYYEIVVGTVPAMKIRNWGSYLLGLRKNNADPKIVAYLDHIREHYRNPVLHPDVLLSPDEAQVLFGVCTSTIVMMAGAMKSATPALPLAAAPALPIP